MKILVTGSKGFIAKNLVQFLSEQDGVEVFRYHRLSTEKELSDMVLNADWIIHLAGVNRPENIQEFMDVNVSLTKKIAFILEENSKQTPLIIASSIQVEREQLNNYGQSKLQGEQIVYDLHTKNGNPIYICRLANVFGKWSRPNYNSVVATFCYNIINDLPLDIHNESSVVQLIYIDDVIETFWRIIHKHYEPIDNIFYITPEYRITLGKLIDILKDFKKSRQNLIISEVGVGLKRALYSTYLSFLEPKDFNYTIPQYIDQRGIFVEMLKTPNTGQFSYFTLHPGLTRGGHYHHSKNEKFLVIKGKALFRFRHIVTGEFYQLEIDGNQSQIVETVPGWTHDITNIGDNEMIVMLWANEIFNRENPDTYIKNLI